MEELERLARETELTQAQMGRAVGMSQESVSRVLRSVQGTGRARGALAASLQQLSAGMTPGEWDRVRGSGTLDSSQLRSRYGSWREVLIEAGVESRWTRSQARRAMREFSRPRGQRMTRESYARWRGQSGRQEKLPTDGDVVLVLGEWPWP